MFLQQPHSYNPPVYNPQIYNYPDIQYTTHSLQLTKYTYYFTIPNLQLPNYTTAFNNTSLLYRPPFQNPTCRNPTFVHLLLYKCQNKQHHHQLQYWSSLAWISSGIPPGVLHTPSVWQERGSTKVNRAFCPASLLLSYNTDRWWWCRTTWSCHHKALP